MIIGIQYLNHYYNVLLIIIKEINKINRDKREKYELTDKRKKELALGSSEYQKCA